MSELDIKGTVKTDRMLAIMWRTFRLMRRHSHGAPIVGEDARFLNRLLRFHPECELLVGPGVAHHYLVPVATRISGLAIRRVDGTDVRWNHRPAVERAAEHWRGRH